MKRDKLKHYVTKQDAETKNKKVKKYQRDTKDYKHNKIYKWKDSNTSPSVGGGRDLISSNYTYHWYPASHTPRHKG